MKTPERVKLVYRNGHGTSSGHLAFGIGSSCHFPMIIISEMFDKTPITIEKVVNLIVSSVIKRQLRNIPYGCVIISEGIFQALSEEDVKNAGIAFTYDDHGHPELGKISKSHIIDNLVDKKLRSLGLNIKQDR